MSDVWDVIDVYANEFDPESDDLYLWASRMGVDLAKVMTLDDDDCVPPMTNSNQRKAAWWSAREAARKMAHILYGFIGARNGQEITPEMIEEMRQVCAKVAYD
jgi:hypothetical protein